MKKPVATFDELLARVQKYIYVEEAMNAKKSELFVRNEKEPEDKKRFPSEGRRPDKNERFQRSFTPLSKQPVELLKIVIKKPGVQIPAGHELPPRKPPSYKFYKFHNDFGQMTNDCRNLKNLLRSLFRKESC